MERFEAGNYVEVRLRVDPRFGPDISYWGRITQDYGMDKTSYVVEPLEDHAPESGIVTRRVSAMSLRRLSLLELIAEASFDPNDPEDSA